MYFEEKDSQAWDEKHYPHALFVFINMHNQFYFCQFPCSGWATKPHTTPTIYRR
jgi:hypothetical protein